MLHLVPSSILLKDLRHPRMRVEVPPYHVGYKIPRIHIYPEKASELPPLLESVEESRWGEPWTQEELDSLVAHRVLGFSTREIAILLGRTTSAVESMIHRL